MILRKRKINPQAAELQLRISLGAPDVKKMVKRLVRLIFYHEEQIEERKDWTYTEAELRGYMEKDGFLMANFEMPWRVELTGWLFCQMLRLGYLAQSGDDEKTYLLTAKSVRLADQKPVNWSE